MRVALVNTNRIEPPIAPIGLEYVAEAAARDGHDIAILDLAFEASPHNALTRFFSGSPFDIVGISFRNTDDCAFANRQSFVGDLVSYVESIKACTDAVVVLGGVGFSTMPEVLVECSGADAGIFGDGELAFTELVRRLSDNSDWQSTPGLVWRDRDTWRRNPPGFCELSTLPKMTRRFFDNRRYFAEGGQLGFETKRGCPMGCVYCADPVAKGRVLRTRPPKDVCDELESLIELGIDCFHTCDCELNAPLEHAIEVCDEMIRRGFGEKIRWYAYCSPTPFTDNLARKMKRAGCAGINFGVDSGDDRMLSVLNRHHRSEDIVNVAEVCRNEGITTMFDLLLGAPGETPESIEATIELMKKASPDRVGVAVGARVYPGTPLEKMVLQPEPKPGVIQGASLLDPVFFIEPAIQDTASSQINRLIGDDPRFLFFDTDAPKKNYNYNANDVLSRAIRDGMRGAYWDILRRLDG